MSDASDAEDADLGRPGLSGWQLAALVRRQYSDNHDHDGDLYNWTIYFFSSESTTQMSQTLA